MIHNLKKNALPNHRENTQQRRYEVETNDISLRRFQKPLTKQECHDIKITPALSWDDVKPVSGWYATEQYEEVEEDFTNQDRLYERLHFPTLVYDLATDSYIEPLPEAPLFEHRGKFECPIAIFQMDIDVHQYNHGKIGRVRKVEKTSTKKVSKLNTRCHNGSTADEEYLLHKAEGVIRRQRTSREKNDFQLHKNFKPLRKDKRSIRDTEFDGVEFQMQAGDQWLGPCRNRVGYWAKTLWHTSRRFTSEQAIAAKRDLLRELEAKVVVKSEPIDITGLEALIHINNIFIRFKTLCRNYLHFTTDDWILHYKYSCHSVLVQIADMWCEHYDLFRSSPPEYVEDIVLFLEQPGYGRIYQARKILEIMRTNKLGVAHDAPFADVPRGTCVMQMLRADDSADTEEIIESEPFDSTGSILALHDDTTHATSVLAQGWIDNKLRLPIEVGAYTPVYEVDYSDAVTAQGYVEESSDDGSDSSSITNAVDINSISKIQDLIKEEYGGTGVDQPYEAIDPAAGASMEKPVVWEGYETDAQQFVDEHFYTPRIQLDPENMYGTEPSPLYDDDYEKLADYSDPLEGFFDIYKAVCGGTEEVLNKNMTCATRVLLTMDAIGKVGHSLLHDGSFKLECTRLVGILVVCEFVSPSNVIRSFAAVLEVFKTAVLTLLRGLGLVKKTRNGVVGFWHKDTQVLAVGGNVENQMHGLVKRLLKLAFGDNVWMVESSGFLEKLQNLGPIFTISAIGAAMGYTTENSAFMSYLVSSESTAWTMANVADTALEFLYKVVPAISTGDLSLLLKDSGAAWTMWTVSADEAIAALRDESSFRDWHHKRDPANDDLTAVALRDIYIGEVEALIVLGGKISHSLRENQAPAVIAITRMLSSLKLCKSTVNGTILGFKYRIPPVGILIWGPAGTGKTHLVQSLIDELLAIERIPVSAYWKSSEKYWSGFSKQNVVVWDDVGQYPVEKVQGPEMAEGIIRTMSSCPYAVPMADLDDKGRTFVNPVLGIVTSNLENMGTQGLFVTPEAALRRFPIVIHMREREVFAVFVKRMQNGRLVTTDVGVGNRDWMIYTVKQLFVEFRAEARNGMQVVAGHCMHGVLRSSCIACFNPQGGPRIALTIRGPQQLWNSYFNNVPPRILFVSGFLTPILEEFFRRVMMWFLCQHMPWCVALLLTFGIFCFLELRVDPWSIVCGLPHLVLSLLSFSMAVLCHGTYNLKYTRDNFEEAKAGIEESMVYVGLTSAIQMYYHLMNKLFSWDTMLTIMTHAPAPVRDRIYDHIADVTVPGVIRRQWCIHIDKAKETVITNQRILSYGAGMALALGMVYTFRRKSAVVLQSSFDPIPPDDKSRMQALNEKLSLKPVIRTADFIPKENKNRPDTINNLAVFASGKNPGIVPKIKRNIFNIKCSTDTELIGTSTVFGTGKWLVTVDHAFPPETTILEVEITPGKWKLWKPDMSTIMRIDGVTLIPTGTHLLGIMKENMDVHCAVCPVLNAGVKWGPVFSKDWIGSEPIDVHVRDALGRDYFKAYSSTGCVAGTSGTPVVMESSKAIVVVGFHQGRSDDEKYGICVNITPQILAAMKSLGKAGVYGRPPVHVEQMAGKLDMAKAPSHRSIFQHVDIDLLTSPDAPIRFCGSLAKTSQGFEKSSVVPTVLEPVFHDLIPNIGPPCMKPFTTEIEGEKRWVCNHLVSVGHVLSQRRFIDDKILNYAKQQLAQEMWEESGRDPIPPPVPLDIALMGAKECGMPPVKLAASAGPLRTGLKHSHVNGIPGIEVVPDSEILADMEEIVATIESGNAPAVLFKWCQKNEPIKQSKNLSGDVRIFSSGQFGILILTRAFFGPFFAWMQLHRTKMDCKVGMNITSSELDILMRGLKELENNKWKAVDGDYAKYDKMMMLLLHACDVAIMLMERSGYSREHLDFCIALSTYFQHYFAEILGDIVEFFSTTPSGSLGTAQFNSIVESIIERMVFILCYMRWRQCSLEEAAAYALEKFRSNVRLMNFGDDNHKMVSPEAQEFMTVEAMFNAFTDLGFVVTDADDKSKPPQYKPLESTSFLKRTFRYEDSISKWVAPLAENSIYKMLSWRVPGALSAEEHLKTVVSDAYRHASLHGSSFYTSFLCKLPQDFQKNAPTFQFLMEEYVQRDKDGIPFTTFAT